MIIPLVTVLHTFDNVPLLWSIIQDLGIFNIFYISYMLLKFSIFPICFRYFQYIQCIQHFQYTWHLRYFQYSQHFQYFRYFSISTHSILWTCLIYIFDNVKVSMFLISSIFSILLISSIFSISSIFTISLIFSIMSKFLYFQYLLYFLNFDIFDIFYIFNRPLSLFSIFWKYWNINEATWRWCEPTCLFYKPYFDEDNGRACSC